MDLIYIGTPFIDLKYGSLSINNLIIKLYNLYKPFIFIVQIPCSYDNDINKKFYDNDLTNIFNFISKYNYKICLLNDIKKNAKSYNLHLIFIKNFKKINFPKQSFKLKYKPVLQEIINKLIQKFDIIYIANQYTTNFAWKPIYFNSYYKNGYIENDVLKVKSYTYNLNSEQNILSIPILNNKILNNQENSNNLLFKYNRFTNELGYILDI